MFRSDPRRSDGTFRSTIGLEVHALYILHSSHKQIDLHPNHETNSSFNMADAAPAAGPTRGGFGGRGRGGDRGGRGRGRGRRGPRKDEEKEWVPVTKLGRLVRAGKIKSMEVFILMAALMLGNLLAFIAYQGIPDCRLLSSQTHR
jgi:hypothetical protein